MAAMGPSISMAERQAAAAAIVHRLRAAGYAAYFAGGCVRDLLLGRIPADFDVATSATPDIVLGMFPRTFAVGAHFGVVLVADACEAGEIITEVATFRSDGAYSDGRRPESVRYTQLPEEDVQRRDFTINGMLLDPDLLDPDLLDPGRPDAERLGVGRPDAGRALKSAVLDFVGGMEDLRSGTIRAIGDPMLRFAEDKLRLLRGVRFAARLGYAIDGATFAAMRAMAAQVHPVGQERVREELTRMLTEGAARRAFELLDETGLLHEVLPEVVRLQGVEQPPQFHPEGDVWMHTLLLLEKLPAGCPPTLAWGALLHDIGKPATFRRAPDRIRFDGHVEVGVCMAEEIATRLRMSNEDKAQIAALVANHMRFGEVEKMRPSTLKRFLRLDRFGEHLELHRLDCLASHGGLQLYEFTKKHFETTPAEEVRPQPLITGRDLIAAGHTPGPEFRRLLLLVEDAQLDGRIHTREEALALVASALHP
ncbi:MAG: CCA tRNA nucleotidyltransferase [Acidobacteriaceae bacterium]